MHTYLPAFTGARDNYRNEEDVGKAVRKCGIPRDQIFVTTKVLHNSKSRLVTLCGLLIFVQLWDTEHGKEKTLKSCEKSIRK